MAQQFLVLDHGGRQADGVRYRILRDGFSFWALLFPLPWLLVKRLWLEAALLIGAYLALGAFASGGAAIWLAALYGFNTVAALWIALDGHHWIVEKHLARGATLTTIISADNQEEAELRFGLTQADPSSDVLAHKSFVPVMKPRRADRNEVLFATPWGNS